MSLIHLARAAALALAATFTAATPAAITSYHAAQAPERPAAPAPQFRLQAKSAAAATVRLPAPDPAAIVAMRERNARATAKRLEVGLARDLGDAPPAMPRWVAVPGGRVAQWDVTSEGAEALRVAVRAKRLPPGAELRFAGSGRTTVYGPFGAADVAAAGERYWSPVLEGETARIELFVPAQEEATLQVAQLSHLIVRPSDPRAERMAKIGQSGSCEVDLICRSASDDALAQAGRSVARMTFTKDGSSFLCTGTLLNATDNAFIPYFYTAAHCISTQALASTLTTHWFYDAVSCNVDVLNPSYVQLPGGAELLYADLPSDVGFLRLNAAPPPAAVFAGWNAASVTTGAGVTAVHHPVGDLKKVSLGSVAGFVTAGGGNYIRVNWNSLATGVTEGGSSGSGLFTGGPASGYQLRGGLQGGASSCDAAPSELWDRYSRLDQAFGALQPYLAPASASTANFTGLWYNPAQSGWGINVAQQGDIVFATLFTYDTDGSPMWLVMSNGARQGSGDLFRGALYRTSGPAFHASPWTGIGFEQVGTMTLSFSAGGGTLAYNVGAAQVSKSIQKQIAATCTPVTGSRAIATNFTDLWYNAPAESEPGWGINFAQQGNQIFATLFTYDTSGRNAWYVMDAGLRQANGSYFGVLYRTTGPVFNAQPWTGIGVEAVGTMRVSFANGEAGTLDYTIDGVRVVKSITRQVFSTPRPICTG